MSDLFFQAGGPLLADSPVYIPRKADEKASAHLRRMEYIILVEPRQHGKTSLINRLVGQFSSQGCIFAYRDLMAAKSSDASPSDWYASLGKWLLRQLHFIPRDQRPKPPTNSASWEDFLADVAESTEAAGRNVVIVLDEIGAMPSDLATDFFSVIRSVYTSRQSLPFWQRLTFIIAGAFNPKELIQDDTVSNFNVDQRIPLDDLNLPQVEQLVAYLDLPDSLSKAVARRIHYWTDGQPYLCQRLCLYLAECKELITASSVGAVVDQAVERFFRDDTHHLTRIKELAAQPDLLDYTRRVTSEPRSRFNAALNDKHFRLAHIIGVIKAGPDGRCRIRNRIYEQALAEVEVPPSPDSPEEPGLQPQDGFHYDAFISYSHEDSAWVRDTLLPCLESEGLRVCIDFRDFQPGVASLVNMENAVERSRKTLIVLTPAWVESEWTAFESLLIQTDDPAGRRARMIPLLLKPCGPPRRIAMLTCVDFTQPTEFEFQLQRLVLAIRSEPMPDAPRPGPEPRVVSDESQEPFASDGQYLRARKDSLERELADTVADMAKVEKQYRATASVIERNRLDLELEALREHRDRLQQEHDSVCRALGGKPAALQPSLTKTPGLRLQSRQLEEDQSQRQVGILASLKEEVELNWALLNNPPMPSPRRHHPEYYDPTRQVFKYRDDAIVSALSQAESGVSLDTKLTKALLAASQSIRFINQQIDELMAYRFGSPDLLAEASDLVRKNPGLLDKFAAAPDRIKPKRLRPYFKELALRHWAIVNEGYWKRLKPSLEALRQPLNQALQQAGLGLLSIPGAVDVDRVSTLFRVMRAGSASDFGDSDFKETEYDDKW